MELNVNFIKEELDKLVELTSDWSNKGIKSIEREIALSKLEMLYETIRLGKNEVSISQMVAETVVVPAPVIIPEPPVVVPAPVIIPEPPVVVPAPVIIPEPEPIIVRPKIRRELIDSLYNDNKSSVVATEQPVIDKVEFDIVDSKPIVEQPVECQNEVITPTDSQPKQILADLYANNASYATTPPMAANRVSSIRGSIGLNDKFLLMRDLFNNDLGLYEFAIDQLDSFDDLNDALIYIHENIHSVPNSDSMSLLVDLLTRKLS